MKDNQVVVEAIAAHNAEMADHAKTAALELIDQIKSKQSNINDANGRIVSHQKALGDLAKDEITEASVFGGSLPRNSNHETIAKVVEQANKNRQFGVEQKSKRLVDSITAEQDAIKALNEQIAELRKKLSEIKVPEVTTSQIIG